MGGGPLVIVLLGSIVVLYAGPRPRIWCNGLVGVCFGVGLAWVERVAACVGGQARWLG